MPLVDEEARSLARAALEEARAASALAAKASEQALASATASAKVFEELKAVRGSVEAMSEAIVTLKNEVVRAIADAAQVHH